VGAQDQKLSPASPPPSTLRFGGAAIYVDDVPAVLDFYRRAFGFETRFFDPEYGYGERTCNVGRPPQNLLIHRDVLKPGVEAGYKAIEEDAARFCATLNCPNVHLALESMKEPKEVLWLTAYDSVTEKQKIIDAYAANKPLTEALAGIAKRRDGLLESDVDYFTAHRADLSGGDPWRPAGARFAVVTMQRAEGLEGSVYETPEGTRFGLRAFKTREAADAAAATMGHDARVFAVRPYWGMPAREWIDADPEFWKANPTATQR
jgi:hypothetical protein